MTGGQRKRLALAWGGLAAGGGVWFLAHQIGSDLTFANCPASGALPVLLIGIVALLLIAGGAFLSWRIRRDREALEGHRFTALLGIAVSAILAFAILLQTMAGLFIPRCWG